MSSAESYYALEPACVIRRILPPFEPVRLEMLRTLPPESEPGVGPDGPAAVFFQWDCGGLRIAETSLRRGYTFAHVADHVLNTHYWDWDGDRALLSHTFEGDVVLRAGASQDEYFQSLNRLAAELRPGENVTLKTIQIRRMVKILRGTWRFKPVDAYAESRGRLELFKHEMDSDRGRLGESKATLPEFAANLSRYTGMEIFIEAAQAPDLITWYESSLTHLTAKPRAIYDPPLAVQHIQDQTGLTLSTQFRNVRRILIEAR